jgi:hypothetical protein
MCHGLHAGPAINGFAQFSQFVGICELLGINSNANLYGQRGELKTTNLWGQSNRN